MAVRLSLRHPSVRCPHCFERTRVDRLHLRCPDVCADDATSFAAASRCPHDREPPAARYCPADLCGKRLEHDYITTRGRIVAVVGSSESGKSTYVGVLINELRNRVGANFDGMAVDLVGDASRARYREVFRDHLFGRGHTLRRTDSIRARHLLEPLLVMLRVPHRGAGRRRAAVGMIVFYDTAGEDIFDADRRGRLSRYLTSADAIVFVLDPLQVASVRETVEGVGPMPTGVPDQVGMLQGIAEELRGASGTSADRMIEVPLAVVLAKTDTLSALLPPNTALGEQARHVGVYDEADGRRVHDEVRALLQDWTDGPALVNTVQHNFAHHRFFGLSALGLPPENSEELSRQGIHPLRVEDPMLWLLARFGLIRGGRSLR